MHQKATCGTSIILKRVYENEINSTGSSTEKFWKPRGKTRQTKDASDSEGGSSPSLTLLRHQLQIHYTVLCVMEGDPFGMLHRKAFL